MTDLRHTIREVAKGQGVTQQQLADAGRVSRQTINGWLSGRTQINAAALERIMERLGLVVTEVNQ